MRIRIQFEKLGAIRFTSHRDVARIFERCFAAAGVPVAWSQGFHPHPRMSFGPALKTGWESHEEYMDVLLEASRGEAPAETHADDMVAACNRRLPEGLRVTGVAEVPGGTPKLASDIAAIAFEAVVESDDARNVGAPAREGTVDIGAIHATILERFGGRGGESFPRVAEAEAVEADGKVRIRYTSTMVSSRVVTPEEIVSATIGDPDALRVPVKVTRLAQYVRRDGRYVSPIDEGVVHNSS